MCGSSWQTGMDNDQGDLGDVVRAGGSTTVPAGAGLRGVFDAGWLQLPPELAGFSPTGGASMIDDFGDPFCSFKDPLLHELAGAMLFDGFKPALSGVVEVITPAGNDGGGGSAAIAGTSSGGSPVSQKVVTGYEVNISSKAAASSTIVSPRWIRPTCTVFGAEDMDVKVSAGSAAGASDEGGLHMPSTRILGIKRRKNQSKKVVSIPAPAAASSKPGGEVVPPDLWAWRKYGQKPIKGSPYPRSYYRCSSSKGCPARKQVERSQTNPNMLVITYTSEHSHPWPTQRNALAGTTRSTSQPAKNSSSSTPKSPSHDQNLPTTAKDESKEEAAAKPTTDTSASADVQEVILGPETTKKPAATNRGYEPVPSFHRSYETAEPSVDDLFAGLGELENNPMRLVFPSRLFMGAKAGGGREDKGAVDPFSMFDWGGSLLGETRKEG
ncbi:hypothetical protein Taro_013523 [Colocasia esculenta]|uniref:WRKY domain-containing protein n=1 Tax=Colocasia esculenta TaxID=4460 RepID=A0A843UGE3_COLES|nr:hypothetical protein [Colocasia esculenta]